MGMISMLFFPLVTFTLLGLLNLVSHLLGTYFIHLTKLFCMVGRSLDHSFSLLGGQGVHNTYYFYLPLHYDNRYKLNIGRI